MAIYEKLMGNPFVDAGVSAICEWLGQATQPEEITIERFANEVVNDKLHQFYCQMLSTGLKLRSHFPKQCVDRNPAYPNQRKSVCESLTEKL